MKKAITVLTLSACLLPGVTLAQTPNQLNVEKSVTINAPASKVWADIKDFGSIYKWHPAVESTTVENKSDKDGVVLPHRLISLKGGGTILEKQTANSDTDMRLEYKIVEGVLPVSGYRSVMVVTNGPRAGESTLTWSGFFYNKANDTQAKAGEDDATAVKVIGSVYDAGLASLKKSAEASK